MTQVPSRRRLSPEERKSEILDVARDLFLRRGVSNVSVSQIISEAGVSKGGFYHHFETKEALVASVVASFARKILDTSLPALSQDGPALRCLNAFFATVNANKAHASADLKIAADAITTKHANELLAQVRESINPLVRAALVPLIQRGTNEGAFLPVDAQIVADCFFSFEHGRLETFLHAQTLAPDVAADLMFRRTQAEARTLDRLLGLAEGSINFGTQAEFETMMSTSKAPNA